MHCIGGVPTSADRDPACHASYTISSKTYSCSEGGARFDAGPHLEANEAGGPPVARRKHLHDVRGTFATRLMTTTDLGNEEIASIMGWSPAEVERIRRIYVDDAARNVALGHHIARGV